MRIAWLRWFLTNGKHFRIPRLTVGFVLACIGCLVVGESGLFQSNRDLPGSGLVEVKRPLRRQAIDDDEIHDSELVKAVVQSLSQWNERRLRRKRNSHRVKRDEEVVCYGELGCFRDEGPFDYLDMLPSSPEEISTRFLLYTRANRQIPQTFSYFNYTTMFSSNFNATAPTKVIIHGFGSTCNRIWASEMRLTLLSVVECNVICVDWENGATLPNYVRAAVNTRLVGKQVALLITWLNEELGTRTQDFHLIGFSLGAHVAGFAGHDLKNLSRITGLDPAGPLYESYDKTVRLDSSDALFVDVIHSNGDSLLMGGLGSWEPMGHVDFYPNGGRVQKGCSNLFLGAVRDFLWSGSDADGRSLCNHRRAYKFFTESISPRCPFPAFSCESYEKFLLGSCFTWDTAVCGNMGYFADRLPNPKQGLLYLVTREDEPFCANQYRITVESSPSTAPISTYGGIEAVLIGHDFINETFLITKTLKESMVPGTMLQRMIVAHPAITEPIQIQLKYTAYQGWLYSGISRWSMDSLVLTNAYGKSVSFCARLLLPSGVSVTIRLKPGVCLSRFPHPNGARPAFPASPLDTHQTATEANNGNQGSKTTPSYNSSSGSENVDSDLSVMKPPAITLISAGNGLSSHPEEMNQAGPPYNIVNPGGSPWAQWHPIAPAPFTPVETFPHVEEENSTDTPHSTTIQNDNERFPVSEPPILKLRICLLAASHNESTTVVTNVTLNNITCIHSDEDPNTLGSNGPLMSNNALGQIASYHQEAIREDELFHHSNAVEVEPPQDENPSSTDLAIPMPPESFWSAVHNKTIAAANEVRHEPSRGVGHDPPIPPHLSYILQQLESQGLGPGPGPKIQFGDRLSHGHSDGNNYLRGLLGRDGITSLAKLPRRLVPSSRALKMRPVSLGAPPSGGGPSGGGPSGGGPNSGGPAGGGPNGGGPPGGGPPGGGPPGAGGGSSASSGVASILGGHRRQSKILDLGFQSSAPADSHSHFSSRIQDIRWLQPPPLRNPYAAGTGSSQLFYVTKNPQLNGKGYYLIPHFSDHQGPNNGGRLKIHRLLQSVPSSPQPFAAGISSENPPLPPMKSYFEDLRHSLTPRWAQQAY